MGKMILVTGGQRSGKSVFSEKLALELCECPCYVATARVYDDEFRERVRKHQLRRGDQWHTVEEPLHPSGKIEHERLALVDCLTLLSTNHFFNREEDVDAAFEDIEREIRALAVKSDITIAVTNEIGLGGVSGNAMTRRFTDLLGSVNQFAASLADEVYFVISGIPLKIK